MQINVESYRWTGDMRTVPAWIFNHPMMLPSTMNMSEQDQKVLYVPDKHRSLTAAEIGDTVLLINGDLVVVSGEVKAPARLPAPPTPYVANDRVTLLVAAQPGDDFVAFKAANGQHYAMPYAEWK